MTQDVTEPELARPDLPAPVRSAGYRLRALVDDGTLDLPLPGAGRTRDRWRVLRSVGRDDLVVGKLAESHADAVAILAEAGRRPFPAATYGVWASTSGGTGLRATRRPAGWSLSGLQRFASGVRILDRALVLATADDRRLLVDVGLRHPDVRPVDGTWPATGMAATDSLDTHFDDVEITNGQVVDDVGWYLSRPGFWIGGIGVAAVWTGGVAALVDDLAESAGRPEADAFRRAALGACRAQLLGLDALLDHAARRVDEEPRGNHRALTLAVRHQVESAAQEVLLRSGRSLGAPSLTHDVAHARRVADLQVFVRQSHGDRDLQRLGDDVAAGALPW